MGISGIGAIGGASSVQMTSAQSVDTVSKGIQDDISEVQRQKQELSSRKDIPVEEKVKKRQELQQEISSLNAKLRQHQAEVRKEKQKELMKDNAQTGRTDAGNEEKKPAEKKVSAAKESEARETETKDVASKDSTGMNAPSRSARMKAVQAQNTSQKETKAGNTTGSTTKSVDDKDANPKNTGVKETEDQAVNDKVAGISAAEMKGMVAADSYVKNSKAQETVIARIEGGVAILKGEIRQDENRGADAAPKRAELEKQEQKVQWASATSFSDLGLGSKTEKGSTQAKADNVTGGIWANAMWDNPGKIIIRDTDYL
ncbi:MAG: FlxA-like family protein [Acetatifactor sp.]|nr:FlxA-like family protein [Acetatifactor sp.]